MDETMNKLKSNTSITPPCYLRSEVLGFNSHQQFASQIDEVAIKN